MEHEPPVEVIRTDRLRLVVLDEEMLVLAIEGKGEDLGTRLQAHVPAELLEETRLLVMRLEQLRESPSYLPWSVRAIIDDAGGSVIGHINFHSMPRADYLMPFVPDGVEIGYTIFPPYRRRGYAIEALQGALRWAHQRHHVSSFVASVSPDNSASLELIKRVGFFAIGEHWDEEDGREIIYVLTGEPLRGFLIAELD